VIGGRLRERRIANRGYRNLQRMERTRERPRLEYRYDAYRFHPNAATPAPAGQSGASTPAVPLARERMEMVHTRRAPRSPLRHPIGHLVDRITAGTPVFGTNAQAQRLAERAQNRAVANVPRRNGLNWR
jgi:hypothetical protein